MGSDFQLPIKRGVTVTYDASPYFLSSNYWVQVWSGLKAQLPVRNLHWRPASRSIRTMQEVNIELKRLTDVPDEKTDLMPKSLVERPVLNIYFVMCEDNDTYRTSTRQQIKEWHSAIQTRKNQEWLIVMVPAADQKAPTGRFYSMKSSVLDKIRSDFNQGKKERCIQLGRLSSPEDPTIWVEFMGKLKEGIMASFEARLAEREEEIMRSEQKRSTPGWNYCQFFLLKETLALTFESMSLYDDALAQYDGLEAAFFQILKEQNLAWFGPLGGRDAGDDSAHILSATKKPYRELLLENRISIFDFRSYVFARQCGLLNKMGKVVDIVRKSSYFIGSFRRTLRANQASLPKNFIEVWTYSSALNVVDFCTNFSEVTDLDAKTISVFHAVCAEILERSRKQLDKLGIAVGHLPSLHPFTMSLDEENEEEDAPMSLGENDKPPEMEITREDLRKALADQKAFDELYISSTQSVVDTYTKAGRKKNAIRLRVFLAALDFHRERFEAAYPTLSGLSLAYSDPSWTSLECFLVSNLLECHDRLKKPRDRAWVTTLVRLLKAGHATKELQRMRPSKRKGDWADEEYLFRQLRQAGEEDKEEMTITGYDAFDICPTQEWAELVGGEDGSTLEVSVKSFLSFALDVDDVRLAVTSRDTGQVWFSSGPAVLHPGDTRLVLKCSAPASGAFVLAATQIRLAAFVFHRVYSMPARKAVRSKLSGQTPTVIRIADDPEALDVQVKLPREIHLDAARSAELEISTGRNDVLKADLSVTHANGRPFTHYEEATLHPGHEGRFETTTSGLALFDLPARKTIMLNLPIMDLPGDPAYKIRVILSYKTASQSESETKTLRKVCELYVALPLGVNVQDFFRKRSLFSKFSVASDGSNYTRIKAAELESASSSVKVAGCWEEDAEPLIVTPKQSASFIFKIQKDAKGKTAGDGRLRVKLRYRTLQEDSRQMLSHVLEDVLSKHPSLSLHKRWLFRALCIHMDRNLEQGRYAMTGEIWMGSFERERWVMVVRRSTSAKLINEEERTRLVGLIADVFESASHRGHEDVQRVTDDLGWRLLSIPLDMPIATIVNSVRVSIASPGAGAHFVVGEPVTATLAVVSSFHWRGGDGWGEDEKEEKEREIRRKEYRLAYDVHADFQTWLISGAKKGAFVAKDTEPTRITFELIPLRSGPLPLPTVSITPLATTSSPSASRPSGAIPSASPNPTATPLSAPAGASGALSAALPVPTPASATTTTSGLSPNPALTPGQGTDAGTVTGGGRGGEGYNVSVPPTCETYHENAAERVEVLPVRERRTWWVEVGPSGAGAGTEAEQDVAGGSEMGTPNIGGMLEVAG